MMKSASLVIVAFLVVMLSSCGINAEPIENPKIEDFKKIYEGEDVTVLVRREIDSDAIYHRVAFGFGFGDNTCTVGAYEEENYLFFHNDKYYDIVEINKFRIVGCDDLSVMGVKGEFD